MTLSLRRVPALYLYMCSWTSLWYSNLSKYSRINDTPQTPPLRVCSLVYIRHLSLPHSIRYYVIIYRVIRGPTVCITHTHIYMLYINSTFLNVHIVSPCSSWTSQVSIDNDVTRPVKMCDYCSINVPANTDIRAVRPTGYYMWRMGGEWVVILDWFTVSASWL